MKIILALDDDNGMMFNKRRQSQDIAVREKIAEIIGENKLWMNSYSRKQFREMEMNFCVDEDFLLKAEQGDYCFVENTEILAVAEQIEEFMIFKWNRRYPGDFKLDLFPQDMGFTCVESEEFPGYSHEKITREVWRKEE